MPFIHDLEAAEAYEASLDQLPAERELPDAADVAFDILAESMRYDGWGDADLPEFDVPPCRHCSNNGCESCHPF